MSSGLAAPALSQTAGTDNRDGRWVLYEEGPVHPMELSPDGTQLWVTNIADATVTVIRLSDGAILEELGAALGPVNIRRRPTTNEMWVVCQSSGAVLIFDATSRKLLDGVQPSAPEAGTGLRLGGEPCGLVFTTDGATAYVTLGAVDAVVPIDAATRTPATPLPFSAPFTPVTSAVIRVEEPRALTLVGTKLYVLSFESGNGTAPEATAPLSSIIRDVWSDFQDGTVAFPPPDRDALFYDLASGTPAGATALWRMGTLNFDIQARPAQTSTSLYVSNVDMNNTQHGEHMFSIGGEPIARHRITFARRWNGTATPPQATGVIDLNVDKLSPALDGERFAVPNEMAFTSDGALCYVACYESKTTAVVDLVNNVVIASLQSSGSGPRGVVLSESTGKLYVYNRADQTVDEFSVPVSSGAIAAPARTLSAGYDGTPLTIKQGRTLHIDASNSVNGLQSCNTCHMDGHFDRVAWDLSEFTGPLAPPNPHPVGKDLKGTKTTMSLRGIEETPPYHWRGDREDLIDFNPAFVGLLGGSELSASDFAHFQNFVFALSYPPDPRQPSSRAYSATALNGKSIFETKPATDRVLVNHPGVIAHLKCVDCHSMDGFSATNNQVVSESNSGTFPDDAQQLRGLIDKESEVITYPTPGLYGSTLIPSAPWGLSNAGNFDDIRDFLNAFPAVVGTEKDEVTQFLREFDSGSAPALSWSWVLTAAKAGSPATSPVSTYLLPQRTAGNCDVTARGWTVDGNGTRVPLRMDFDSNASAFVTDQPAYGPYTYAQLDALALSNQGVFCFFGVSVGMGQRLGRDRDSDFAIDGAEAALGALSTKTDTDLDTFPDGYEILWGSQPNNAASVPTGDTTAPTITPASGIQVWRNSRTAKLRWTTSEECTTKVTVATALGPITTNEVFHRRGWEREHVIRVRHLHPGQTYVYTVEAKDASGNVATQVYSSETGTQSHLVSSVHSADVALTVQAVNPNQTVLLKAEVTVVDQDLVTINGTSAEIDVVEWLGSNVAPVGADMIAMPDPITGKPTLFFTSANVQGSGATVEVIVKKISDATLLHFHPLEKKFSSKTTL